MAATIRHFRELDMYKLAMRCGYLNPVQTKNLEEQYEYILGKLVNMISHTEQWTIHSVKEDEVDYA